MSLFEKEQLESGEDEFMKTSEEFKKNSANVKTLAKTKPRMKAG